MIPPRGIKNMKTKNKAKLQMMFLKATNFYLDEISNRKRLKGDPVGDNLKGDPATGDKKN